MKGRYLITTEEWFIGPDGKQYKAVWGDVTILDDTILGVKTNRNSVNWYVMVGGPENHMIVAGCQVKYAIRCDKKPENGEVQDYHTAEKKEDGIARYNRPTQILVIE